MFMYNYKRIITCKRYKIYKKEKRLKKLKKGNN